MLDRTIRRRGALAGETARGWGAVIVPIIVEGVRIAQLGRAGESRLGANRSQAHHDAEREFHSERAEAPVERQTGTRIGSGVLMVLAAVALVASALTSLTLLWFAIKGIQWLLLR